MHFLILTKTTLGKHEEVIEMLEQAFAYKLPLLLLLNTEPLMKPLRKHPRFQEMMNSIFGKASTFEPSTKKTKKPLLDSSLIDQYKEQLNTLLTEEEPFLNSELTLRVLAEMMEISPNHLSWLLNTSFDKNYNDFINSYRLEYFKGIALKPESKHVTILGLAYDSGFNSKSVFNNFFKKNEGITPKAWLKSKQI